MAGCGRTPTLLWDSVAAEIGCDAVRPLSCVAGIFAGISPADQNQIRHPALQLATERSC